MKLTSGEREFYARQMLLHKIGEAGQLKLKKAGVLVVGAGGLGCPVLQYLAAAGVGTIGVVDFDTVEVSNLHRQILFDTNDIGKFKAECAAIKLSQHNPFIKIKPMSFRLTVENTCSIISEYDIIIDGTDNFETRYMLNDAVVLTGKTLVYGSVQKFEGQVSVFNHLLNSGERSATYRCLFPNPPAPGAVANCSEAGVMGVLPGMVGVIQATEAIKILTGTGVPLTNRLLTIDAASMKFTSFELMRNENLWGDFPKSTDDFKSMNYNYFCGNDSEIKSVQHSELEEFLSSDSRIRLLDVRELYEEPAIKNAIRIPLSDLPNRMSEIDPSLTTVVFCSSGIRSIQAIRILQNQYSGKLFYNLQGGWKGLEKLRIIENYE